MDYYNIILIVFIIAIALLSVWWAFNSIRTIDIQKNYNAEALSSIAKLWRRAKFVPEDAKERESLYLYRDFLQKFDEKDCKYPIMVKNGKVRCMTRQEYDTLCGQKDHRPISILITSAALIIAIVALGLNIAFSKNVLMGVVMALIVPALETMLYFIIHRANKEKNAYREAIFQALKENSVNFLSITKPFIVLDAYPQTFNQDTAPLYAAKGELTPEQIAETRDFIIRQKAAETAVVLKNVDRRDEIDQMTHPRPKTAPAPAAQPSEPTAANQPTPTADAPAPADVAVQPATAAAEKTAPAEIPLTPEEEEILINNFLDDHLRGEVTRAQKAAALHHAPTEPVEALPPLATAVTEPQPELDNVTAPADDDFSLDAIGQALDAEIAKRNKRK